MHSGYIKFAAWVIMMLCGAFVMVVLVVWSCGDIMGLGQLGDSFNILGVFFTALAFGAVIWQLGLQHKQMDEERSARLRSERISAISALSERTYDKIVYERGLLHAVASGLKDVSFMHDSDRTHLAEAIKAKEQLIDGIFVGIQVELTSPQLADIPSSPENPSYHQQLITNQTQLQMMKQMKEWMDDLANYESELKRLLAVADPPVVSPSE